VPAYWTNDPFGAELQHSAYALDSTTIDLCLAIYPWARFRERKGAVAFIDLHGNIPVFACITDGKVHDVNILDQWLPQPGAFYVIDRGYLDLPDLTGLWMRVPNPNERVTTLAIGPNVEDFTRPGEKIPPLLPAAEALYKRRLANQMADRPSAHCLPHGIPDEMLLRNPIKIVQNPGVSFILYEQYTLYRQIFTDGRPLPRCPVPPGLAIR
jgi:hypothetical protein